MLLLEKQLKKTVPSVKTLYILSKGVWNWYKPMHCSIGGYTDLLDTVNTASVMDDE